MSRLLLGAGALIALDRDQRTMWLRVTGAWRRPTPIVTHAGVLGQVWRGKRQARLARALAGVDIVSLTPALGRRAGELLAAARTADVIDAALVLLSRSGDTIYTSDPDDLLALLAAARLRDVDVIPV